MPVNKSVTVLALRIAQIEAEYSKSEISAALSLLKRWRANGFLEAPNKKYPQQTEAKAVKQQDPLLRKGNSQVVLSLRGVDEDKFRLLADFELMLRDEKILRKFEDVKRFCGVLGKNFKPKKSRKETIGPLITFMSRMSATQLAELIEKAKSISGEEGTNGYQDLADYIIKGRP